MFENFQNYKILIMKTKVIVTLDLVTILHSNDPRQLVSCF